MESSARIGRWKDAVSRVQSARKKKYCSRMGCVARKLGASTLSMAVPFEPATVLLVPLRRPEGNGGKGGGGESGSDGEDGVAFSMRAHVKYTSKSSRRTPRRMMVG